MNDEKWKAVIEEARPYKGILESWFASGKNVTRIEIYSQVDSYPISNLAKMHLIANFFMGEVVEAVFNV